MKSLLKKMARPFWRMSAPVRRPLVRKFDRHMMQLLHPLSTQVAPTPVASPDLDLVLNSVVRELGRLQMQVEALQEQLDDRQSSDRHEGRLSVVAEIG